MRSVLPAAAVLISVGLAAPVLAAKPISKTHSAHPPAVHSVEGSGAPYLARMAHLLESARTVQIRGHIHITGRTNKGERETHDATMLTAWTPERFMQHSTGPAGDRLVVGTGQQVYLYDPRANQCVEMGGGQSIYGRNVIKLQLAQLLGAGPHSWTYQGIHPVDGHPTDLVVTRGDTWSNSLYLDRSTHLPRRAYTSGTTPAGTGSRDAIFTQFDVNGKVPAALFQFTPPRGCKIVVPKTPSSPARGPRR